MFKSVCLALSVAVASVSLASWPQMAEAKRLGGGKPAGIQRSTPAQPAQPMQPGAPARQQTPQQAAQPAPATPAAAPKRSWLGPLAGLAAGLGIAALLSHFGMGEAFANAMMVALLVGLAVVVGLWVLRKFSGNRSQTAAPQWAGAGAPWPTSAPTQSQMPAQMPASGTSSSGGSGSLFSGFPAQGASAVPAAVAAGALSGAPSLPADFDAPGFERIAKMIFIRMQAANDAADLDDLRKFTTPELFASLRLDLQDRGQSSQQTDVVQLNASLADWATEASQHIASVRFSGLIREEVGAAAAPFDEVWHLVRPSDASQDWRIAGITPTELQH
jgi:predicted lipid-binding transport protein (Tim44 family)